MYGEGARIYERHADTSLYNARYERPAMLALIGDVRGMRVLDAGCAAGYYAATLAATASEVIALDASDAMIELVRAKRLPNVDARVHDLAEPLSWIETGSVDLVLSSLALHYLPSWEIVLSEFQRVLRPNGRAIVSTHHPAMTAPLVSNYFETQLVEEQWTVGGVETDVSFYHRSLETILGAFLDAGLILAAVREPHLEDRIDATESERKLALRPWFLIVEAVRPEAARRPRP